MTNFGSNPSNLRMYVYVPNNAPAKPAVLVAVHYCTGSGPAFYSGTEFASLADRYGFIVIYPSATRSGGCFDVSSPQALTHDGGSDPVGIVSMVNYVEQHYNGDPNRVFVTGASSGAHDDQRAARRLPRRLQGRGGVHGRAVRLLRHHRRLRAGTAPAPTAPITKTPQQWGDLVRGAYPGYTGARPRMQLWHGTEDDHAALPQLRRGDQAVDQRPRGEPDPDLHRHTRSPAGPAPVTAAPAPPSPVEAISIQGVGHSLPQSGMAAARHPVLRPGRRPPPPAPTTAAHRLHAAADPAAADAAARRGLPASPTP